MIEHVSDTALWTAACRAAESERPDALFRDPYAASLAGEKGRTLAASLPSGPQVAFALAIRTVAVDRLIGSVVTRGIDTIVNLGAGLDARPYRMKLPPALRWIEVDFGPVLDYKTEILRAHAPSCRVERIAADLSTDSRPLSRIGAESRSAAVLTEGVVAYLTNDEAARLSRDLASAPAFKWWIQDYRQGRLNRRAEQRLGAPFRFEADDPIAFFARDGWTVQEDLRILDVAAQVGRKAPLPFPWNALRVVLPGTVKKLGNKTYGYALLGRT